MNPESQTKIIRGSFLLVMVPCVILQKIRRLGALILIIQKHSLATNLYVRSGKVLISNKNAGTSKKSC